MLKVICLYSGGLDSILALKIIQDASFQKMEIIPIRFITPFFNYKNENEINKEAIYLKSKFNANLRLIDITEEFLEVLYFPKYGYGKNLNPCIDCKILMLQKAKQLMKKEKASFIITGEVIGQRPKSQKKDKLQLIGKQAGIEGYLVRPLSAKLLQKTIPEFKGFIDREKLLSISGKRRVEQLKLAKQLDIKYFATPSGGCLLTDPEFSRKVRVIKKVIPLNKHLINLLKFGRAFLISKNLLIIGRNDLENKKLLKLASKKDLLIQPMRIPGPLCVYMNGSDISKYKGKNNVLSIISSICAKYSIKNNKAIIIQYGIKETDMENTKDLKKLRFKDTLKTSPIKDGDLKIFKV